MKLLRSIPKDALFENGCVAAIGNFDGVHLGHQVLLSALREQANARQLPMVVILFEPQPREFFLKKAAPPRLSRLREKLHKFAENGVEYVFCLRFDQRLALMLPHDFAQNIIFQGLQIKCLLVGHDFRFGRDRRGHVELLVELARPFDCVIQPCPDFCIDQERVSSTQVRDALQQSDFPRVRKLLGREYSMSGRVMHGEARGRVWGVPTANLNIAQRPLPLKGVFCVQVRRDGYPMFSGVANLGQRPTIEGTKQILEVHLFDMNDILYDERLEVFFLHKLRDEVKFPSLDALITQIHADVLSAKTYFLERAHGRI